MRHRASIKCLAELLRATLILVCLNLTCIQASAQPPVESIEGGRTPLSVTVWIDRLTAGPSSTRIDAALDCDVGSSPRAVVPKLVKLLGHNDNYVRLRAADLLGEIGPDATQSIAPLLALLKARDSEVRRHAAAALAKFGRPAFPALFGRLNDRAVVGRHEYESKSANSWRRTEATVADYAAAILYLRADEVMAIAIEQLKKNPTDKRLSRLCSMLIFQNGASAIPTLRTLLHERNPTLQALALTSLSELGPRAAPAAGDVKCFMLSRDVDTVFLAAEIVVKTGKVSETALALGTGNAAQQSAILRAIGHGESLPREVIAAIAPLLSEADSELAEDAMLVLANAVTDITPALSGILNQLQHGKPAMRRAAALTLARQSRNLPDPPPHLINLLIEMLTESRETLPDVRQTNVTDFRCSLAEALGGFGLKAKGAISVLISMIERGDDNQSSLIESAARILRDEPMEFLRLAEIWLKSGDYSTRGALFSELRKLGARAQDRIPDLIAQLPNEERGWLSAETLLHLGEKGVIALAEVIANETVPLQSKVVACQAISSELQNSEGAARDLRLRRSSSFASRPVVLTADLRLRLHGALIKMMREEKDERTSIAAIDALCVVDIKSETTFEFIASLFDKASGELKKDIIVASASFGSEGLPLLRKALGDLNLDIQVHALRSLGELGQGEQGAINMLRPFLTINSDELREAAVESLQRLGAQDTEVISAIIDLLTLPPLVSKTTSRTSWKSDSKTTELELAASRRENLRTAAVVYLVRSRLLPSNVINKVISTLSNIDRSLRNQLIEALPLMAADWGVTESVMHDFLLSPDAAVRKAAAKGILAAGKMTSKIEALVSASVADIAVERYISHALSEAIETLHPYSGPVPVSGSSETLPDFPWPPPPWIAQMSLPQDVLGPEDTTLGDVCTRLASAIERVDPGFEHGLFGNVPGGFAVLTRLERINRQGQPMPDASRWIQGRLPITSLSDYLARLFFEQAGLFRAIAFVFSEESNFRPDSRKDLPDVREGGLELPQDIAQLPLKGRKCTVLVYGFEKKFGKMKIGFADSPSAREHLQRSGIWQTLGLAF